LCFPTEPKNDFERIVASKFPNYEKFRGRDWDRYFPSIRQIAYRVSSWKKLGDFPEDIDRADDTVMDIRAVKAGLKYAFAKDAKVYWSARDNLKSYLKLAYKDSISDGQKGIIWKRKIYLVEFGVMLFTLGTILASIFLNIIFLPLILLFPLAIFFREGYLIFRRIKNLKLSIHGGIITILLFFSHGFGALRGLLKKYGM